MSKKPWMSKTLIFAVLFGAVQLAGLFGYLDYTPTEDVTEIVNIVVAVVVVILRLVTEKKIEL